MSKTETFGEWHELHEDDLSTFPDSDRYVLVSFSNFSVPIICRWEYDPNEGGSWCVGDMDETCSEAGLFVDGWWELPEKPEREDA